MELPDSQDSMLDKLHDLFPGFIDVEDVPDYYYHCDDGWLAVIFLIIINSIFHVPVVP